MLQNLQLDDDIKIIKEIIISSADNSIPMVQSCIESIVNSGGKMLRPAFLIISSRIGQPDQDKIYKLAAGVELLHISSLIHDDIIDGSDKRRQKPAVHKVYGMKNSVLLGDYFFSKSFSLLAENTVIENGDSIGKVAGKICESEIVQNLEAIERNFGMRSYIRRITAKTAILFTLCFHLGAVESGCSGEIQSTLRKIGYNTGIAFQIIDDILDYTASEDIIGKPVGSDLKNGIITAPAVFAANMDNSLKERISKKKNLSKREIVKIIKQIDKLGAIDMARDLASKYTDRSLREIASLPDSYTKESLEIIIKELLLRKY